MERTACTAVREFSQRRHTATATTSATSGSCRHKSNGTNKTNRASRDDKRTIGPIKDQQGYSHASRRLGITVQPPGSSRASEGRIAVVSRSWALGCARVLCTLRIGRTWWFSLVALAILTATVAHAQTPVLQRGYDAGVTGANLGETSLNTTNVAPSTFGLVFTLPVDDAIFAQPLYVPNVVINQVSHNVVYVA